MELSNVTYLFCSLVGGAICYVAGYWIGNDDEISCFIKKIVEQYPVAVDLIDDTKDTLSTLVQKENGYLNKIKYIVRPFNQEETCFKVKILDNEVLVFNKDDALVGRYSRDFLDRISI